MKFFRLFLSSIFVLLCMHNTRANNIQVTAVTTSISSSATTVTFSIRWDNSWRGGQANNYDAAWVFIKYYDDNFIWQPLELTGDNIIMPAGLTVEASSDKRGLFIYRSSDGVGNIPLSTVTVGVKPKAGSYDVKVFGLEMVYIPQGPFFAGYNNGAGAQNYGDGSSLAPLLINSAFPPTMGSNPGQLWDPRGIGTINSSFPTGYNAFYIMKYELSQAGYRDFLNSINHINSSILPERSDITFNNYATVGSRLFTTGVRNGLEVRSNNINTGYVGADANNNNSFNEANDGEWTACGSLYWSDAAAFLDWACLRPMTELEYEKASNGPDAQPYPRFASGTYIIPATGPIAAPFTNAEIQTRTTDFYNYINTSDALLAGPLRGGFAADASSNRKLSGGSYYGVMEMSGNLWEPVVTTGNAAGRSFTGRVGDGILSYPEARANTNGWPGAQNITTVTNTTGEVLKTNTAGIGRKGGSFVELYTAAVTSVLHDPAYPVTRPDASGYGARGVRQP